MNKVTEKYLSRKLVQSYVILTLSFFALMLDKIDGTQWITIAALAAGIYAYGNLKEKEKESA